MIHFEDQSEELLEGAAVESISIPPPDNLPLYKAPNPAKTIQRSEHQQVTNLHGACLGVTKKERSGHCSHTEGGSQTL